MKTVLRSSPFCCMVRGSDPNTVYFLNQPINISDVTHAGCYLTKLLVYMCLCVELINLSICFENMQSSILTTVTTTRLDPLSAMSATLRSKLRIIDGQEVANYIF